MEDHRMKKYINSEKGSSLVITIVIFAVLIIFATFISGFMVTENKQSIYHEHKTQAYYVAKSAADVIDGAIRKQLREAYGDGNSEAMNNYITENLDGLSIDLYTNDEIEKLGAESIDAKTSLVDVNGSKLLAIDVEVKYKGVSESIRKIVSSYLTVTSSGDGKFEHQGLPIVAIDAAWRKDKDGRSDLTNPSLNNGKLYAEKPGESTIFTNVIIPTISWDMTNIGDPITNPTVTDTPRVDFKNRKVVLTNNYTFGPEVEEIYVYGDLEIRGRIQTQGTLKIYVYGGVYIYGASGIKPDSGESEDISFYIYYNNSSYGHALEVNNPVMNSETVADFYVEKGKTLVLFKKNIFKGNIATNDPYVGSIDSNGMPTDQNNYNIKLGSDDSSNQINFFGSIWAPDSYVIMGGNPATAKNAIPQKGMILGRFVEIDGLNHKKNFEYLDTLLKNSGEAIKVPGEISTETTFRVLRFRSDYVDIPK